MKKFLILSLTSLFCSTVHAVDVTNGPLQHHPALCDYGYNPDCRQNNGAAVPPKKIIRHITVNVPSKYGALATNKKTGAVGGAINMNSLAEAKTEAIKRCEDGGRHTPCKVITWAENGCFASAQGKLGTKWKSFYATRQPGLAENAVLAQCRKSGASNCKIVVSESCSIPDGMYN